jgi:VanZ family protein
LGTIRIKKFIPGIAWFFLVNLLCFMPGSELPVASDWMSRIYFDKWVHVGLFTVLAFLFMYPVLRTSWENPVKRNYFLKIALAASLWGLVIEFIQKFYISGRSFDLYDWLCDSAGALIALLFTRWLLNRAGRNPAHNS